MQFNVTVTLEPIITRRYSCFVGGQVQEKYLPLFTFIAYYYVFGYYSWFTLARAYMLMFVKKSMSKTLRKHCLTAPFKHKYTHPINIVNVDFLKEEIIPTM